MNQYIENIKSLPHKIAKYILSLTIYSIAFFIILSICAILASTVLNIVYHESLNPYVKIFLFGIVFKVCYGKYLLIRQNEKDKQSDDFGYRILTDESDRLYMKQHIESVEKDKESRDSNYFEYKKIEEYLKSPESYRVWKNRKMKDIEYKLN